MLGNSGLDAIHAKSYKSRLGTCFAVSAQSTKLMSSASDQRIRHVAIVLQSLDAATSRGLLGQLPPTQSKLVRQAMVHLGTVTPQERAAAFQSMQGLLNAANTRSGLDRPVSKESLSPAAALLASQQNPMHDQVDLSPEAISQNRLQDQNEHDWQSGIPDFATTQTGGSWQYMPAEALADILQGERPIVIATVINQVSVERATAIAQALPIQVAAATLAALPHLHLTDAAILRDIQLELERKIGLYHAPKQANAEGLTKLQAIVAHLPVTEREHWTKAIAQSNPVLAAKLGWRLDSRSLPTHSVRPPSTVVIPQDGGPPSAPTFQVDTSGNAKQDDVFEDSILLPFSKPSKELANSDATESKQSVAPKPIQSEPRKQPLEDLLQFSDKDFVAVLHACQPQTVLLALSGASKAFVARVERLVPAKDVKRLRERLNSLGKIQLREVDSAQMEIAEVAMKLFANGAVGATASVSFTAAA